MTRHLPRALADTYAVFAAPAAQPPALRAASTSRIALDDAAANFVCK